MTADKKFINAYRSLQICHTLFNFLWMFRIIQCKPLWWLVWAWLILAVLIIITHKEIRENIGNNPWTTFDQIRTNIWAAVGVVSLLAHSPKWW
ncbi:MAG: hypothetical protein K6B40_03090 [Firmicutes bacterium]|nr:hypothetical protein [Bacillota bacterium]